MFVGASFPTVRSSACIAALLVCPNRKRSAGAGMSVICDVTCIEDPYRPVFVDGKSSTKSVLTRATDVPPGSSLALPVQVFEFAQLICREWARKCVATRKRHSQLRPKSGKELPLSSNSLGWTLGADIASPDNSYGVNFHQRCLPSIIDVRRMIMRNPAQRADIGMTVMYPNRDSLAPLISARGFILPEDRGLPRQ